MSTIIFRSSDVKKREEIITLAVWVQTQGQAKRYNLINEIHGYKVKNSGKNSWKC